MSEKSEYRSLWALGNETAYLNHGSFGACPRAILKRQQELRERLESNPMRFFVRDFFELLEASRISLAAFLKADPKGVGFVTNATTAVNAVLRSLKFRPNEEILVTDHGYGACNNTARFVAGQFRAKVSVASIPFPVTSEEEIIQAILRAVTPRTRLAIIDHVTSPTALVLPVSEIVEKLEGRGIEVLVDGAHAPGMIDLHIGDLEPSYYTGNCHKWMCAPKGAAFLYVREDRRNKIVPAVVSHGLTWPTHERSRYHNLFDWQGTHDPTAYLVLPFVIDYMASLHDGGWKGIRQANHDKAVKARRLLCRELRLDEPAPENFIGAMASIILPQTRKYHSQPEILIHPLQDVLAREYQVEAPVISWGKELLLRISAQLYNRQEEYEFLADCLKSLVI